MSVDIAYSIYNKKGNFIYGFATFNEALNFITIHDSGYKWSYNSFWTNEKVTRVLPKLVYIVKEIDTGGGYSRFGKIYWYNVDKLKR